MRFGLALPQYDFSLPGIPGIGWPSVREWARRAEELGFHSVWLSDHLFLDIARYGATERKQGAMECLATLAALASATERVRLGTLVVCNDLRLPTVLAKTATAIDLVSDGRLELGMGAGWYEDEYRAAGVPFEPPGVRIARLAEALQIVTGLLSRPEVSFRGKYYHVQHAVNEPQPVQSPPTVWLGGKGDRLVSLAGRLAGGYNTAWAWSPEAYAGRVQLLERAAWRAGRDPASVRRSVGLSCLPGTDPIDLQARWDRYLAAFPGSPPSLRLEAWRQDKLVGTPEAIAATVEEFAALGVEEVILSFGMLPFQVADASAVELFASEVFPLAAKGRPVRPIGD
jgi:probable F420-dependent oxidoreductase